MQKLSPRRTLLIKLLAATMLPWLVVIGSNTVFEAWLPGSVRVDHWRDLSSAAFLSGALVSARLLFKAKHIAIAVVLFLGGLCLAFIVQLRSMCGDEPVYIGEQSSTNVASCQ